MNTKLRAWGGGAAVTALAVGTFAWGAHLGPGRPAGHDLLRVSAAGQAPSGGLTLAALQTHVAQEGGVGSPYGGGPDAQDANGSGDSDSPGAVFQDIYSLLRRNFVDPLPDDSHIAHGAAAAMLASLQDPATRFLEAPEMAELAAEAHGGYQGLGAVVFVRKISHPKPAKGGVPPYAEMRLTIVDPVPGGPAQKAGLKTGDYITAVNGQPIAVYLSASGGSEVVSVINPAAELAELTAVQNDIVAFNKLATTIEKQETGALTVSQAESKLDDGTQKSLALTITRPGEPKPQTVTVDTSAPTSLTPVSGKMLPGGFGYLKVAQFTVGADTQFTSALQALGPATLKGLVLDLRDCPGGLRDVGAAVAANLTTGTTLGILEAKGKKQTPLAITPDRVVSCPIAVLVNGGTANTAELVASALQAGGAKLVGTQTFGDAEEVKPIKLHDGSGFTMTVGRLLTARGQEFADRGLRPDVTATETTGADAPLAQALGTLSGRVAQR